VGKLRLLSYVAGVVGIFLVKWKTVSEEINVTASLAFALLCCECGRQGGEEKAKISLEIIGKEGYGKQ